MRHPDAEGMLHGSMPYLRMGQGPPLVIAAGISLEHALTGMERRLGVALATPFAEHFRVHYVSRRRGLTPGVTMSDLAAHLAAAIEHDIGEPVLLHGTSTGGSVALQLAIDRPDLVRRLVLLASACRLSPYGRAAQARAAREARSGDPRRAYARMMTDSVPRPVRPLVALGLSAHRPGAAPVDPTDLIATIEAEDAFDAEPDLPRVTAPTLVIGGALDSYYSPELFRCTATGVQDGRAHVYPDRGHATTIGGSTSPAASLALGFLLAGTRPFRS